MSVWARIDGGRVAELTHADPEGRFHPDIDWKLIPDAMAPWVDNTYIVDGADIVPPSATYLRRQMNQRLAARRYLAETGGCQYGGRNLPTHDRAKAQIALALALVHDDDVMIDWKWSDTEFAKLSATDLRAMAIAVAGHVQNCFTREATIISALQSADSVPLLLAVYENEADRGWPDSQY